MPGVRTVSVSRPKSNRLRAALLASASLSFALLLSPAQASWVGEQGTSVPAGTGGAGEEGGPGPAGIGEGGGGGGAGTVGGVGGDGSVIGVTYPVAGTGGAGGTAAILSGNWLGGTGQGGTNGINGGAGGGGGGGAHGYVGATAPTAIAIGGDGGTGGAGTTGQISDWDGSAYYAGGGASGGNGGYGATIIPDGSSGPIVISLTVSAGDGGEGGSGGGGFDFPVSGAGGNGGNGGTGLYFAANSAALVINGDVEGGAGGGQGEGGPGAAWGDSGDGGVGLVIVGDNNSITITANGSVTGGLSGDEVTPDQADAIHINGNNNTLTLQASYTITGDVDAVAAGNNTLALGGTAPGSFDVSQIDDSFNGFANFAVTGGTWTLTNTNSNAINTIISSGTLSISQGGSLGGSGSALTLNGPGVLQTTANLTLGVPISVSGGASPQIEAAADTTLTIGGAISGGSILRFTGDGTVNLTGANTFAGTFEVADGTLVAGSSSAFTSNISVAVASGASLTLNTSVLLGTISGDGAVNLGGNSLSVGTTNASSTFSGTISGSGTLIQQLFGTLTMQGAQLQMGGLAVNGGEVTLTGGTVVQSGLVPSIGSAGTLGLGQNIRFAGLTGSGTLDTGGKILTISSASNSAFAGSIVGSGRLTKAGTGTFTLSGTNTYTGNTNVNAGTLLLSGGQAIANSGQVIVKRNGTLQLGANETIGRLSGAGTVALGGNILTVGWDGGTTTFSGTISGGGLTKTGTGTLVLTGTAGLSGGLTISGGTVQVGNGAANGALAGNVVDNGTLAVLAAQQTVLQGTISGTGGLSILSGSAPVYLTANNTYSGNTAIASGATLFLGNGGPSGAITGNIVNDGSLVFNSSAASTYGGSISGTGKVTFQAGGTTTLAGASSYSGGTLIASGTTVAVNADANLGAVSGALSLAGGTLSAASSFTSARSLVLDSSSTLNAGSGVTFVMGGTVSQTQASTLTKTGAGTLVLSGANSYTGGTQINGGSLLVSADANLGAAIGGVGLNGGTLTATESFTSARIVTLGATGGTIAAASGKVLTLSKAITGSGGLTVSGPGTLALTGTSSISGSTTVSGGTLALYGGSLTSSLLTVASGGTLAGYGTIGSTVQVASGATLQGGVTSTDNAARSALVTNNLTLAAGSSTILTLGNLANAGVADVNGSLSASGTLTVTGNVVHGAGYYRAFSYTGSLSNALTLGSVPVGYTGQIDTSTAGQVNILLTDSSPYQVWTANGSSLGGSATWSSTSTTWFEPATAGTTPLAWGGEIGIFMGSPGAISIAGRQSFEKLEFVTSGYVLSADPGHADSQLAFNNGGVLWVEGGDVTATISAPITGAGGLKKIGTGVLVLTGNNTYTGGTDVAGGVLKVGADGALGAAGQGITLSRGELSAFGSFSTTRAIRLDTRGTLSADAGATLTVSGSISGTGDLRKEGAGTVLLSGNNSYGGNTLIAAGTLLAAGGNAIPDWSGVTIEAPGLLSLAHNESIASLSGEGRVDLSSHVLTISGGATTTFIGSISGAGQLRIENGSTVALAGDNSYTGGTSISGSTLFVGAGGTSGSIQGDVVNDGTLAFFRADTAAFGGAISGSGTVAQIGTGTLILSGNNSYTGGTLVTAGGTLQVSQSANLGSEQSDVVLQKGTLAIAGGFATSRTMRLDGGGTVSVADGGWLTLTGSVIGTNGLTKSGAGTLILAGSNSYSGGTVITQGRLQVGDGGSSGSLPGDVKNDGVLAFNLSSDHAYGGTITGTGTLVQSGTGRLILTGDSRATGGTIIERGTLQVGDGGTRGSVAGPVVNNGVLLFARSDEVTFGSPISGTGSVANAGGVLILTGANSYSGGTDVGAGATVQVSEDANLGSALGAVTLYGGTLSVTSSFSSVRGVGLSGSGTVEVLDDETFTLSGAVSGSGTLVKSGEGTLVLTADSSYSGNTVIASGTLQAGNGGTGGSVSGDVANAGTLRFLRSDALTVAGAISGAGQLVQAGSGTVILTGANTYTGGTLISAGTLMVGDGGTSGSIPGNVVNNGTLAFNRSDAVAFGGIVSGSGGLMQIGPGILTLTGANTYTGGTLVGAGATLAVSSDANLGGLASDISLLNGGTLLATASFESARDVTLASGNISVASGASFILDGTVSGTGGLGKTGTGMLFLTAANTYQGGTTISGGALAVFADTNLGDASGGLALDGGTLVATASFASARAVTLGAGGGVFTIGALDQLALSGPISGAGVLYKAGGGTLVLTGANSYGGLAIDAGTVIGNSASISGDVLDNGALVFNQAGTGTYAGNVSGSGSVTKTGAGTLAITGTFSQTGGTTITSGTLQVGDGGASGWIFGPIVNNATLAYDLSSTYTFPFALTGSGDVVLQGGGTVDYAGSTFTGPIALAGAHVILARGVTSASAFTVGANSVLSGVGTIGALTVANGGVIAPGYSPGTIGVTGNALFQAGSLYRADVQPSRVNDLINVGGSVQIDPGSTVEVVGGRGSYANSWTFTIVAADGGVTGTFSGATSNFAFLDPILSYGANYVDMTLVRNAIPFASEAYTANERATAMATDTLKAGNPVYDAVASQLKGEAYAAFDALSGEVYASAETVMQQQSIYVREAVGARLRQAFAGAAPGGILAYGGGPETAGFGADLAPVMWMQAFGGWGNSFSNGNAATISNSIGGVMGGVDTALGENWRLGLYGGFSQSWFDVADRSSSGSMDNYDLGLYAGAQYGAFAIRLGGGYTWHDVSASRTVAFPGYAGINSSDYGAGLAQIFGEVGYGLSTNGIAFEPFAGLAYVHLDGGSGTEVGSDSALAFSGGSMDTLYGTLGLRAGTSLSVAGRTLSPSFTLGWQHAFGDTTPEAVMTYAVGSAPFTIAGAPIASDAAVLGAALTYELTPQASLSVRYDGQIASTASQNAFTGQFQVRF